MVDALEEFKIVTNSFSAEYGRTGGGVILATIKSGANAFHGTLFEFLRNDALNARNFFAPQNQPKPVLRQNQFGAARGWPDPEGQDILLCRLAGHTHSAPPPSARPPFPLPQLRAGNLAGFNQIYDPDTTRVEGNSGSSRSDSRQHYSHVALRPGRRQGHGLLSGPERARVLPTTTSSPARASGATIRATSESTITSPMRSASWAATR